MPISDITPPPKKPQKFFEKKENFDIKKEPKNQFSEPKKETKKINFSHFLSIFSLFSFFVLLSFVFLNFDFSYLKNFLKPVVGDEQEEKNFYSSMCEGDWQSPENIVGMPEASEVGSINSFSDQNSAVYKSGTGSIVCGKFKEFSQTSKEKKEDLCGEDNNLCKISSAKVYFSLAIDEASLRRVGYNLRKKTIEKSINASKGSLQIKDNLNDSNLDAKVVIWYSLDKGENWRRFKKITTMPISNYLNGGYISFDAPFLKDWEDIQNMQIKVEGAVGGEENIIAFLDSVWVGANPAIGRDHLGEMLFSIFKNAPLKISPEKIEAIEEEIYYEIPQDGRIVATVKSPEKEAGGIFRMRIFSEENNLVSDVAILPGGILNLEGYDVPSPIFGEITSSLFGETISENKTGINVKKEWSRVKINIEYIPISDKEEISLNSLEIYFYPMPVLFSEADYLEEFNFGPQEKEEREIDFKTEKGGEIIIELGEVEKGGSAYLVFLDEKNIGAIVVIESGGIISFPDIAQGDHRLIIKHVHIFSGWENVRGDRTAKIYFKEKND